MPSPNCQIVHSWMFGEYDLSSTFGWLREVGADGVDLSIPFEGINGYRRMDGRDIAALAKRYDLPVLAVTPLYMRQDLDLSHANPAVRRHAVEFARSCLEISAAAGCDRMLVSPSWISVRHSLHKSYEQDWNTALDSLAELAEHAGALGVTLMLEPINRYRVGLVHTVAEALRMIGQLGSPGVGIVADCFHMQMEEQQGITNALRKAGGALKCLHLADNTRQVPGKGCFNWAEILGSLAEIGFDGPLSHEPVSLYFNENKIAADPTARKAFLNDLRDGLATIRGHLDGEENL